MWKEARAYGELFLWPFASGLDFGLTFPRASATFTVSVSHFIANSEVPKRVHEKLKPKTKNRDPNHPDSQLDILKTQRKLLCRADN